VTTFTLAKFAASPGNTPKNTHGYDLDITNNGASPPPAYTGAISSQFTVTAIPEPSSLIFAGLGALITICSHARRCRRG
jgi:hypothetical protein